MSGTTKYHSQYWAHALTLRSASGSIETLSRSLSNARVDLNPHQVDAALFALRSPLSKGVILADEVGLGKTIEVGIVIAQRWAERHRSILLIVPATLRKQWQQELEEKFYLPTVVLDSRQCHLFERQGMAQPFQEKIIICSYQFAAARANEIARVPWDLAILDEAHRLRNVYKNSSKMARTLADALIAAPKLLLTATPLQNALMELYGLVSIIDDHVFGDAATFREQYTRLMDEQTRNFHLRERLKSVCIRTLRKQVVEYIPFTRRVPFTQEFSPSDDEQTLYDAISDFLRREKLYSLPASQRMLITLVLRKLLASSSFAIAATLHRLIARLKTMTEELDFTDEDLEGIEEYEEEWSEGALVSTDGARDHVAVDRALLADELNTLRRFADMADAITVNAKGEALLPALRLAFDRAQSLGAPRKAVVFTESRRTQQYLFELLRANGFEGKLALMNGTNTDPLSTKVYQDWRTRHAGQEIITGSRPVDVKAAIVEYFRDEASVLIATEAAAEGINLQFCSLVVNYDLPWNPQRVEQLIGRCHRYGQKHDVVVVNFFNKRNEADKRVVQLLSEKFNLFDGIFGASDEVLGALESGVDIERRIAQVYQTCRSPEEITAAFDALQAELDEQIQSRLTETRQVLLENFDADVSERLRVHKDKTLESLSERERWLMGLTKAELDGDAIFDPEKPRFRYHGPHATHGHYHFDWKKAEKLGDTFYRQNHPLAVHCIDAAIARDLPPATVAFDYAGCGANSAALKSLVGRTGWLDLSKLTITSLDSEEFLIFAAQTDDGEPLDQEQCRKLFQLSATVQGDAGLRPPSKGAQGYLASDPPLKGDQGGCSSERRYNLEAQREAEVSTCLQEVEDRNARFFDEEVLKLDRWSDDLKQGLEREIKELDKQIREARKESSLAAALQDKLAAQKKLRGLEGERNRKRKELFESQDAIDAHRDTLITKLEGPLRQEIATKMLFTLRWTLH